MLIALLLLFHSMQFFDSRVNWRSFTRVRVTASLLRFPRLFSVSLPTSTMLWFGWSPLVHRFPTLRTHLLWGSLQVHQLQLASPPLSYSIVFCFFLGWGFFFCSLTRSKYLSPFLSSLILLCCWLGWQSPLFCRFSFLLTITRSGCLAGIWWSVCISKSLIILCVSFSRTDSGLWVYHLVVWSNFSFLHNFQRTSFPIQSYLVLCYFCASLLYSLIMWSIVSSLSSHNLHLLFCCSFSISSLI